MKVISVRQPWAWLIIFKLKDIENRTWATKFRGRILIHAAKGMTRREYETVEANLLWHTDPIIELPPYEELARGGIIGSVEITDCVSESNSEWFGGPYGFVLRDPRPMEFLPWTGRLGIFEIPDAALPSALLAQHAQASIGLSAR